MPTFFQKPENALKRANEFIEVAKPEQALEVLKDLIKSKRHRIWQKTHEPIMLRYLELCVDLKKSYDAKEGLYQYKNICQQVNVKSLDTIVRRYLEMAEERTEAARAQSHATVEDVDDLDVLQTPESLLLAAVSAEDAQDRSDRAILTPWVKFLWESYRQCLELLRNNNRVERLYHDIAKQAFEFCLKYTRKTEFRKLCDNLRNHLKNIVEKTHTMQNAVSLSNPDTLSMHLETRLHQLDFAIQMELWQEAFKAVEDIHDLIIRSKKVPKPSLLVNYFEKFGLVFWKSNNRLFHAAACHRLFVLVSEQKKNPSPEEITRMANRVLCATLAIPIPPTRYSIDQLLESNDVEKRRKLASLLSLPAPPTRNSLVKDLLRNNVIQYVSPELKQLYKSLEVDFDPLSLSQKLVNPIKFVEESKLLNQYVLPLQEMTVVRLIKQIAQIYQTIEFARLRELAPFVSAFELEKIVVQAAKNIDLPVRLNHSSKTVSFGTDLNVCLQEDVEEGPFLQHMPGEQLRNQLQYMAQALTSAIDKLNVDNQEQVEAHAMKLKIMDAYKRSEKRDRERILNRRHIIEDRKEELENASKKQTEAELTKEKEKTRKLMEAEEKRLKKEMEEREKQRAEQEHRNIRRKEAEKRIEQLKTTDIGVRALEGLTEEELAELDTDDIVMKQVQQMEKEKKELLERLKTQEKKIDYFIRAKHIEEIPLLKKHTEESSLARKDKWDQQEKERIEGLKRERDLAMQHRDRLRRMLPDKDAFIGKLKEARHGEYLAKLDEYEVLLDAKRQERLEERREMRKRERREKAIKEREARKQREKEEAIRREREERLAREREEEEEKRRQQEEHIAKLKAQAEKQRAKEAEIEERERVREMSRGGPPRLGGPTSGGWRERESAKHDSWMRRDGDDHRKQEEPWGRGGSRDEPRRDGPRDDRGPRDFRDDRGPRDFRDDRGPRDFRDDRGPRDFRDDRGGRGFRDDRGGFRDERGTRGGFRDERGSRGGFRDDRDEGTWARGMEATRDERGGRDMGRRDDRSGRGFGDDGGNWRAGGGRRDDGPPKRDDRQEDSWRRGGAPSARDDKPRDADPDGWNTVKYSK